MKKLADYTLLEECAEVPRLLDDLRERDRGKSLTKLMVVELKKRCGTWPPQWLESATSLRVHWRNSMTSTESSIMVLSGVLGVLGTGKDVPGCMHSMLSDILEEEMFRQDVEYSRILSQVLFFVSDVASRRRTEGINEDFDLSMTC
jgi:hypothetical protein